MTKKKGTARPKISDAGMPRMGTNSPKVSYLFRGRTIQIAPPNEHDVGMQPHHPRRGMLSVDGRDVMYEQTAEGVYSHEMMYQRFSTPEELAEELVRQWGTHIPPPAPMSMRATSAKRGAKRRSPRRRRRT